MQTTHFQSKCEFAARVACVLGLIVSLEVHAQAPAPAPAPTPAPAPKAPAPAPKKTPKAPAAAATDAAPAPAPAAPAPAPQAPPPEAAPAAAAPPPAVAPPPPAAPVAPSDAPAPVIAPPPAVAPIYPPPEAAAQTLAGENTTPWNGSREAQERPTFYFGYEIALPMGDLHDFIEKPSYRGFEFGTFWPVFRSLYVGGMFSHHVFYEEEGKQTYPLDSGAVTANLYRYARFWSFAGAARYQFMKPDAVVRPFVGLRMGMTFTVSATLVSDLSLYDEPIGFLLAPEAGVLVRLAPIMQLSVGLRYDYSTASSGNVDNASFMPFQFALVFHGRQ